MRNLKRVLSLALAVVMVIGMMVMTTSAADIADIDDVKNTEAVTVMNALKVLEGDENGVYNPTAILTREQAAKIICVMLMGKENADLLVGTSNFTDVAADRWSAGYIAYCASLDVIAGNGDGTFNPTGELTGVAFAKMLLVALGYDAKVEGYVNNANWATNIGSDAIDAGLNVKGVDLSVALTRDNAAQMAFQALEADMVEYETKGTTVSVNGIDIVTGASKAEPADATGGEDYTDADTSATDNNETTLQFCEKYFEDLRKVAGTELFGRPCAHAWEMNNETVHTVVNTPVATFTTKTMGKVIASKLAGYKVNVAATDPVVTHKVTATAFDTGFTTTVAGDGLVVANGESIADAIAALTTNGDLVEIYAHPKTKVITRIVSVNYAAAAEVQTIETDKKTGDVTYKIGGVEYVDFADEDATDEVIVYDGIAKGDIVTTATSAGPLFVYPTTSFEGTQTATKTDRGVQTITIDGEKYTVGVNKTGTFTNQKDAYTYYVDQYGFVVYCAPIEDTASTDYLQIVDMVVTETTTINGITPSIEVRAVLADGTVGVYDLLIKKMGGTWKAGDIALGDTADDDDNVTGIAQYDIFGYTIENGKLALEALTDVPATMTGAHSGEIYFTDDASDLDTNYFAANGGTALLTKATTFVIYNIADEETTVFTGYDKLADLTAEANIRAVVKAGFGDDVANCKAQVVFATVADATKIDVETGDDYVYIVKDDVTVVGTAPNTKYVYNAFAPDGSEVEITTTESISADGLYALTVDGSVTNSTVLTSGTDYVAVAELTETNNMVKSGSTYYYMTEDTEVIYVDGRLDKITGNKGIIVTNRDGDTALAIFVLGE